MRHSSAKDSTSHEPVTPLDRVSHGNHQCLDHVAPRSKPHDYQDMELVRKRLENCTVGPERRDGSTIESPRSPHHMYSATPKKLTGADKDPHEVSREPRNSLLSFSLSSDGEPSTIPGLNRSFLTDNSFDGRLECELAAVKGIHYKETASNEWTNVSKISKNLINASHEDLTIPEEACSTFLDSNPILTYISNRTEERPYTDFLGTPDQLRLNSSQEPSEISDAGQQLNLRQKRKSDGSSELTESSSDRKQSYGSPFKYVYRYELQKKIIAAFKRTRSSHGHSQEFLPEGDLYKLINQVSVGQELMKELGRVHDPAIIDSYTRGVCVETHIIRHGKSKIRTYRKIFALLVLVGTTASTPFFLEEGISDLDLPLNLQPLANEDKRSGSPAPFERFEYLQWSPIQIRTFQEYQWKMLAPFFAQGKHGDVMHYPLHDQHILPFLTTSNAEMDAEKSGGFARVLMVRIHPEHHNFRDQRLCHQGFAVKQQIHTDDRETFKREIAVLKKFSGDGRSHKHIISLLATFEQFNKINLLFYRADGDLFAYWRDIEPQPKFTYGNVKWVAEQCEGLTEALLRVHKHLTFTKKQADGANASSQFVPDFRTLNRSSTTSQKKVNFRSQSSKRQACILPWSQSDSLSSSFTGVTPTQNTGDDGMLEKQYGRHGDINPGNILWFNENDGGKEVLSGTLKIADFGQSEFNSLKSRTAPRDVANTLTYRPPECDRLVRHELPLIRQTYDIWCLGCVLLEFVTWLLGGDRLQMEFAKARMTPDFFQNSTLTDTFFQVRRELETDCHEVMVKPAVAQAIDQLHRNANCSEFCHDLLNLVQCDMLIIDSSKRSFCNVIWKSLRRMLQRCRMDKAYAVVGRPWSNRHTSVPQPMIIRMERKTKIQQEAEMEATPQTTLIKQARNKYAKRNERRSHRNNRNGSKPDQKSQKSARVALS